MEGLIVLSTDWVRFSDELASMISVCERSTHNPVASFVSFFNLILNWNRHTGNLPPLIAQATRLNDTGEYNEIIRYLTMMQIHIGAVVNEFSLNRTPASGWATSATLRLGGTDNLPLRPVWYWLALQDHPSFQEVSEQAMHFMKGHGGSLIASVEGLRTEIKTYEECVDSMLHQQEH